MTSQLGTKIHIGNDGRPDRLHWPDHTCECSRCEGCTKRATAHPSIGHGHSAHYCKKCHEVCMNYG